MSNGGNSLLDELDAAYLQQYYQMAKLIEDRAAAETALLDVAYQRGKVEQVLSDLQAKAQAEVDEIAKRLKGDSGGESPDNAAPGGTADVGPSPVG